MIREQVLGIVAMEPMGEYDATVKYEKLNIVTFNGSTYCALKDTLGNEPTNENFWQLVAEKGDKGDTYVLTEEDKENIKNEITENANSGFNKNVEEKTTTFDNHVTEKTSSFDTNSLNKTNEFNTNATNKVEEYNTNADARLNEYNANADGLMTIAVDTRNELERIKNDVLETGEASGTFIHLKDSTMAEYQELEVDGTCEQGENPSPEYPQEITVIENSLKVISCNKNLIDIDLIPTNENSDIQTTKNNNGSITIKGNSTSQWINVTNYKYCPFNKNVNYCFSIDKVVTYNVQLKLVFADNTHEVKTIRAGETSVNFSVSRKVSYYYIYIYNGNTLGEINDTLFIQLEEGTQATYFEEHLETVINANLGNEFVGGIRDDSKDTLRISYNEEDGEYHLYLDKVIGKITFDGTQNISGINASLTNTTRLHFANILPYTCTEPSYFKSNRLLYKGVWAADEEGMYFTKYSKDVIIRINKATIGTTKEEINNWLSKNPMEVYYKINEPYTIDLGVVEMPITYDEATNLFTDSNLLPAINAKYYRNFTETVRNLQINNETLKNELASFENRLAALEAVQVSVVNESEVIEQ